MNTINKHASDSSELFVLIHGMEGSATDWLEKDGYTKGGNVTELLGSCNKSWIATDLYGHGEWKASEPEFSTEDISDELWPLFLSRSASSIKEKIAQAVSKFGYKEICIITYSAGIHVAVKLLKEKLPVEVTSLIAAVPPPEKEYDDEFSLHNNLSIFENKRITVICGTHDDEIPLEETRWFFNQITNSRKMIKEYPSGHSLPIDWVNDLERIL